MRRVLQILLPIALVVLLILLFGSHYNTNDDEAIELILRGIASDPQSTKPGPFHPLLNRFLSQLYVVLPNVPWYGLIMVGLLTLSFALQARFFDRALHGHRSLFITLCLFLLFFSITWPDHLLLFNYNRVGILLGISALIQIPLEIPTTFRDRPRLSSRTLLKVGVWTALFGLALLIRPYTGYLAALLVFPYFALDPGIRKRFLSLRFKAILFLGPSLIILLATWISANNRYEQTPELRQGKLAIHYLDYNLRRPGWMLDERDSMRKRAFTNFFYADDSVFNEAALNRITYPTPFSDGRLSAGSRSRVSELRHRLHRRHIMLRESLMESHRVEYRLLIGLLLMSLLVLVFSRKHRGAAFSLILYLLSAYLLILLIFEFYKMHDRVLAPMLTWLALVGLVYPIRYFPRSSRVEGLHYLVLAVSLLGFGSWMHYMSDELEIARQNEAASRQAWPQIVNAAGGEDVVVFISGYDYLVDRNPFRPQRFAPGQRLVFIDGWTACLPAQKAYLKEVSGEVEFARQLTRLGELGTLALIDSANCSFVGDYFSLFYQQTWISEDTLWSGPTSDGLSLVRFVLE